MKNPVAVFEKAWNIIDGVFEWSSETDPPNAPILAKRRRSDFYESIFVDREGADKKFDRFLLSENTILILWGHVGIGKTTFLRSQLEKRRVCNGIVIDCNRDPGDFLSTDCNHNPGESTSRSFVTELKKWSAPLTLDNLMVIGWLCARE